MKLRLPYAWAFLLPVLALVLTWPIRAWLSPIVFPLFFAAVILAAWMGGRGPGLAATLLGAVLAETFLVPPVGVAWSAASLVRFAVAGGMGLCLVLLVGALRRARSGTEEERRRLQDILDQLPAGVLVAEAPGGRILLANSAAQRINRGSAGLQEASDGSRTPSGVWPLMRALKAGEGVAEQEVEVERADGTRGVLLVSSAPLFDVSGRRAAAVVTYQDVTDRVRAREQKDLLAAVVESSDDMIVTTSLEGVIRSWNAGAERMLGYTAAEAVGRSVSMLVPPDQQVREADVLERIRNGSGPVCYEARRRRKDGRLLDVSVVMCPLSDGRGRVIGASRIARDITPRRAAEESVRRLNRALHERMRELEEAERTLELRVEERTAKLKDAVRELERFCYTIAHDLRAPLRAMTGFTDLLMTDYRDRLDETGRDYGRRIRDGARRMDAMILDLLAYGRVAHGDMSLEPVPLAEAVAEATAKLPPHPEARIEVEDAGLRVRGDAKALKEVVANLMSNALKFRAPDRPPHVRVKAEPREGRRVRVWVEDDGIGIPTDQHERIFGLFQKLHRPEEFPGSGIGLAIARKAIERMNGRIGVESEPGHGSRFWFELEAE